MKVASHRWLFTLLFAALIVCRTRASDPPDFLAPTKSIGHERLLTAARTLKTNPIDITNNIPEFLNQNQSIITQALAAIKLECEAPINAYDSANYDVTRLMALRKLANVFVLKADFAAEQDRLAEAVRACLDAIQIGMKIEHGPLIYFMVGSAVELKSIQQLESFTPRFNRNELASLTPQLIALNKARLPFSEVKRREDYFIEKNKDIAPKATSADIDSMFKNAEERYLNTTARVAILSATVAAAQYRHERERHISALADLAPHYIKELPIDPYSEAQLRFSLMNGVPVIYSVGPNKRDDSGQDDDIVAKHKDKTGEKLMLDALRIYSR